MTTEPDADFWERVLAFHATFLGWQVRLAVGVLFVTGAFLPGVTWKIPFVAALVLLGLSYWVAMAVRSVRGFRSGYHEQG